MKPPSKRGSTPASTSSRSASTGWSRCWKSAIGDDRPRDRTWSGFMAEQLTDAEAATGYGRVRAVQEWLRGRADTPLGRLALQWFRAYFAASRNAGCAATVYSSLSVLPAALVAVAYFHPSEG